VPRAASRLRTGGRCPAVTPIASVVIPAHNESTVIGRLLGALAPMTGTGELDVHVVCNGCDDDTSRVAGTFEAVRVHTLARPSKSAALNLGDEVAGDVFPRLYMDADIVADPAAVRGVVDALERGPALAAAPRLRVVLDGRPRPVRDFYDVFVRLPWVTDELVGSGFYGLSREGRARFDVFPDVLNDDLYIRSLFSSAERRAVSGCEFSIEAPRTTAALIRAKARVYAGTQEFLAIFEQAESSSTGPVHSRPLLVRRIAGHVRLWFDSPFWEMAHDRALWVPLANYGLVRMGAVALAQSYRLRHRQIGWEQDRTTRGDGSGGRATMSPPSGAPAERAPTEQSDGTGAGPRVAPASERSQPEL